MNTPMYYMSFIYTGASQTQPGRSTLSTDFRQLPRYLLTRSRSVPALDTVA